MNSFTQIIIVYWKGKIYIGDECISLLKGCPYFQSHAMENVEGKPVWGLPWCSWGLPSRPLLMMGYRWLYTRYWCFLSSVITGWSGQLLTQGFPKNNMNKQHPEHCPLSLSISIPLVQRKQTQTHFLKMVSEVTRPLMMTEQKSKQTFKSW